MAATFQSKTQQIDVVSYSSVDVVDSEDHISPADFVNFLPWACNKLRTTLDVIVDKISLDAHPSTASTKKLPKKDWKQEPEVSLDEKFGNVSNLFKVGSLENVVRVKAIFYGEYLEQIKFLNNKYVPRDVLKVVGLTVKFQVMLTSITINRGMDKGTVYELAKILHKSNINDLNFDDAFCQESYYDMLLEHPSKLKSLSLARCKIEDSIVIKMAKRLVYTETGTQTLSILNLSSNRITNDGARALSEALRSNRYLTYLNLANNWIDDDGALAIINVLQPFMLNCTEIQAVKAKKLAYLRKRNIMMHKNNRALKSGDPNSADKGKKKPKVVGKKTKSPADDDILKMHLTVQEDNDVHAEDFDEFDDPFSSTMVVNGVTYCNGNYSLAYLNMAYNNLSFCILEPFVNLLKVQSKRRHITNRGLISVVIEGNPLPANCKEIKYIEYYIGLQTGMDRRASTVKKSLVKRRMSIK